jgi:RNA polymerase-interacting CarD/CdnL/TRCF family regulator
LAKLAIKEGLYLFVPGFGPAVVVKTTDDREAIGTATLRFLKTGAVVDVPFAILRALGVRALLSRLRVERLLAGHPVYSSVIGDKVLLQSQPLKLMNVLLVARLRESQPDLPAVSPELRGLAEDLLISEFALVLQLSEEATRSLLDEAIRKRVISVALEDLDAGTRGLATHSRAAPSVTSGDHFVESASVGQVEFFGSASGTLVPGRLEISALAPRDSRLTVHLMSRAAANVKEVIMQPFGLNILVTTEDFDRHADILIRSTEFAAPADLDNMWNSEVAFLALYPSGAIRSAFVQMLDSNGSQRARLEDPSTLLDPDADPPRVGKSGAFLHRAILAGFNLA